MIITDWRKKSRKDWYVMEYLTRFKGYNADLDKWLNSRKLRNAPKILEMWHKKRKPPGSHPVLETTSLITDFYGILPASPVFPPKIVPWYIKVCHLFQFLQHHSNSLPFTFHIILPCLCNPISLLLPSLPPRKLFLSIPFPNPMYSTASLNRLSSPWH